MDKKFWNKWQYDYFDASVQVFEGAGWISLFTLTSKDSNPSRATFYDGHNTSGDHIKTLRAPKDVTIPLPYAIPIYIQKGLYIDLSGDVDCVSVQYLERLTK